MNLLDLTVTQLKRAAAIKEQIEVLNKELRAILSAPAISRAAPKTSGGMSASVKRKIAAAQRARWAKIKASKAGNRSVKSAGRVKTGKSPAGKAK